MSIDVGDLRRRLGTDKGPLSQAELAKQLRVNQSTISRIERGEMKPEGPLEVLLRQLDEASRGVAA